MRVPEPKSVKCSRGHPVDRQGFQDMIDVANPQLKAYAEQLERSDSRPRTNPDGDVSWTYIANHPDSCL